MGRMEGQMASNGVRLWGTMKLPDEQEAKCCNARLVA